MVMWDQKIKGMIRNICHTEPDNHLREQMKGFSCKYLIAAMSTMLCASQSAQAFFCFSFGLGNNDHDRYGRLPPIAPPARYAPHPSTYLMGTPLPTPGVQPGSYFYPASPVYSPMPAPAYSPGSYSQMNQTK